MSEFLICLGKHIIGINAENNEVRDICKRYVCDGIPSFSVSATKDERQREKKLCPEDTEMSDAYLESLAVYRKICEKMVDYDTVLMHGSVVAVDGEAFLFTAKSGTGKSTHTRFWREGFGKRAVMVNDDKPLLKLTDDGVLACGTPWDGKHRLSTNVCVPLKAICILERGEENEIRPITAQEALPMVFQQTYRPKNLARYMEIIDKLTQRVAFYRLRCNMSPEAAKMAYEAMK